MRQFADSRYRSAFLRDRVQVNWGGLSQVESVLLLLRAALRPLGAPLQVRRHALQQLLAAAARLGFGAVVRGQLLGLGPERSSVLVSGELVLPLLLGLQLLLLLRGLSGDKHPVSGFLAHRGGQPPRRLFHGLGRGFVHCGCRHCDIVVHR